MVSKQILRVPARKRIRGSKLAAAIVGFVAAIFALHGSAWAQEDTVIIDLRSGDDAQLSKSRDALRLELGKVQGIRMLGGPSMDAALRGVKDNPLTRRGKSQLAAAALAYGRLDCKAASRSARLATINYAALQASKINVRDQLRRAYVYMLLCAHNGKDAPGAATAVARLRALGFTSAPDGVSSDIWTTYPAPTSSSVPVPVPGAVPMPPPKTTGELEVSKPAGANVWVDHVQRGHAPVTVKLPIGEHIVAVANSLGGAAQLTKVKTVRTSIVMTIQTTDPRWSPVTNTIAGWKTAGRIVSTKRLAELLRQLKVRFALVMFDSSVTVWGVQKYRKAARKLGAAVASKPVALASIVTDHASAWDGRSPDPSLPLLTESNTKKLTKKPHKWWVYASIIGAVAVGAAVIIAQDSADDNQRIRLTFP